MSATINVLVVEDSELAVEGIRSALNAYDDIEVIGVATTGTAAIELVRRQKPDVVLLDLRMRRHAQEASKEQVGLEVLTQMHQIHPDLPIFFLTAHATPFWVQKAMQQGAKAVLNKEASLTQIVLTLRTAAAGMTTFNPEQARFFHQDDLLTAKEMEVLGLMAEGKTNDEIAAVLHIVPGTVAVHVSKILAKLQVQNRTGAVKVARESGIIR